MPSLKNNKKLLCFVIGEAPGLNETIKKIPFCGKSGKKLDYFLSKANIDRSTLYITNIVKCRPIKNAKPTLEEIKLCSSNLIEELLESQTNKILILGSSALNGIRYLSESDDKRTIMQCAYTIQKVIIQNKEFELYIAPHPAFFIYNKKASDEEKLILLLSTLLHAL